MAGVKVNYIDDDHVVERVAILQANVSDDELNKIQEYNDKKLNTAISDFDAKGTNSISTFEANGTSAINTFNTNGNNAISTFNTKGDEAISKLGSTTVDTSMSSSSTNAVQNKVIKEYVDTSSISALNLAKDYADNQLQSAKDYTDSQLQTGFTTLQENYQKKITSGTSAPSGGSDGDIYIQY